MGAPNISALDYFDTAKAIVREHAAATLAKVKRAPKPDFESYVYVTDQDGEEWEIEVGICYDASYTPGKFTGPWEDSYPDDGSMDLTAIVSINDLPPGITDAMVTAAAEEATDRLTEEAWEDYFDKRNDWRE